MNNSIQHPTTRISRPLRATAPRKTLMASMLIGSLLVAGGCDATATSTETAAGNNSAQGSGVTATQTATATAITTRDELASATHYDSDDTEYDESEVTTIELATTTAEADGQDSQDVSVTAENGEAVVTISGSGVYRITGTLSGQVVVTADDEASVQLVLDNADISSAVGPALLITAADEVTVIIADGTTNSLADAASRTDDESDPNYDTNAALFSRSDLTLAGTGTLQITGNLEDGIHSKDGLVIDGPTLTVTALDDGIIGKDYVVVADGALDVTAVDTGIGSDNDEEADRGWLSIIDGTVKVATDDDAIKAENAIAIAGGVVTVTRSNEGTEAASITIIDGIIDVTSADDAINASGGYGTESTSDDTGAATTEMAESNRERPTPPDGDTAMPQPPDDGSGDRPAGGPGGGASTGGTGGMEAVGDQSIVISGGTITINAGGDGIDSNGSAVISGGDITVFGPENDGNGALDVAGTFEITGGTLTAVGSAGMAQSPDSGSAQASVSIGLSSAAAGTAVAVTDATGNVLTTVTLAKSAAHLVFSSPDVVAGQTYEVYQVDSSTQDTIDNATLLGSVTAA